MIWERFLYRRSRPQVFSKKCVLRNLAKFAGKHQCLSLFFNGPATLLKKKLWYRCFPVNFPKFLRTFFFYSTHLVATFACKTPQCLKRLIAFQEKGKKQMNSTTIFYN